MIWNSDNRSVHPRERLAAIVYVVEGGPSARLLGCRMAIRHFRAVAPLIPTPSFRLTRTDKVAMGSRRPLRLKQRSKGG